MDLACVEKRKTGVHSNILHRTKHISPYSTKHTLDTFVCEQLCVTFTLATERANHSGFHGFCTITPRLLCAIVRIMKFAPLRMMQQGGVDVRRIVHRPVPRVAHLEGSGVGRCKSCSGEHEASCWTFSDDCLA